MLSVSVQPTKGTDFDPNNTDPDILNLWRGLSRIRGHWEVIRSFLLEIIANRNIENMSTF